MPSAQNHDGERFFNPTKHRPLFLKDLNRGFLSTLAFL
jgi:hypothetical protein